MPLDVLKIDWLMFWCLMPLSTNVSLEETGVPRENHRHAARY